MDKKKLTRLHELKRIIRDALAEMEEILAEENGGLDQSWRDLYDMKADWEGADHE